MKTENSKKATGTLLYFAYGSNMNRNQMAFRCPDAEPVDTLRLLNYRLAFRDNGSGTGVATILPERGSYVDGVLWRISTEDERHLDHYEGFPRLYGKDKQIYRNHKGERRSIMMYVMNSPYKEIPARPSAMYLEGIIYGCWQNRIDTNPILEAVRRTIKELPDKEGPDRKPRRKDGEER